MLGDSFILFNHELYNLTYTVNYFDFFESRSEVQQSFLKMKDLKAKELLGERLFPKDFKHDSNDEG